MSAAPQHIQGGPQVSHLTVADDEYAAVSEGRIRIRIGAFFFMGLIVLIILRLAETSILGPKAAAPNLPQSLTANRADIVDRRGEILATTLQTYSLYAEPHKVWNAKETAQDLSKALPELNVVIVGDKLTSKKSFIWIARGLTPKERQTVFNLGLPGLAFRQEPKRVYPREELAAHVIGFSDTDMNGVAGAERAFDERLSAPNAPPKMLSIDMRVQFAVADALAKGLTRYQAKTAAAIVMDIHNGEILAMVSLPDYDPNMAGTALPKTRFNHAAMSTYELGSVFKPITVALAIEAGVTDLQETYPVHKPLKVNNKIINDDHPSSEPLNVPDILAQSSNRGTAMLALRAGAAAQKALLNDLGLFARVPYELAESARPQVQDRWIDLTTATVSYGHGLSVTPLAFAAASAALVNGGYYVTPTITLRDASNPPQRRRVINEETSEAIRDLMRYVVTNGTGRNARAKGYRIMGKTGTADKPAKGGYADGQRVTSFISAFPYEAPKYLVFVTYDEPQPVEGDYGFASAGWNAAKTTKKIINRIGPILGVKRHAPELARSGFSQTQEALR